MASRVCFGSLPKTAVVRTMLYMDQTVSQLELDLWHTSVIQRLYYIRQLGFADRVFPDAVHNRFNHTIGTVQRVDDILMAAALQTKPENVPGFAGQLKNKSVSDYIKERIDVGRLMAVLHDITHIPFGHTLEDELNIFKTKHDDSGRLTKIFNRLSSQFIWGLYDDYDSSWPDRWSKETMTGERFMVLGSELLTEISGKNRQIENLDVFLVNLLGAQMGLLEMHHAPKEAYRKLFIFQLLSRLKMEFEVFNPSNDHFLIDAIGNTICADLLDYSRRDFRMTGMTGDYDDRIFRSFILVEHCKDNETRVCLALKVFSNKLKPDVLREVLRILELRYDEAERVLFHPAKCCAGAMLGRIVSALGISDYLEEMLSMGDEVFLNWVENQLEEKEKFLTVIKNNGEGDLQQEIRNSQQHPEILKAALARLGMGVQENNYKLSDKVKSLLEIELNEVSSALALATRLRYRHYYQLAFEVTTEADDSRGKEISTKYKNPAEQNRLVHEIEDACYLPRGTILVHCPKRNTNFKEAEVLIHFSPDQPPVPLKDADEESPQLARWAKRARDISDDYNSIWRLRVFIHKGYPLYLASVVDFIQSKLRVSNSQHLQAAFEHSEDFQTAKKFLEDIGGKEGRVRIHKAIADMKASAKSENVGRTFAEALEKYKL